MFEDEVDAITVMKGIGVLFIMCLIVGVFICQ
jgi:hypothetical protein